MTLRARFVDSISAAPTVRLDLTASPWTLLATSRFDPPGIKRSRVSTLLTDGARYPASAYDDRLLELELHLEAASTDAAATAVQDLARELDRHEVNFFEYRLPDQTNSVFFRTVRLALEAVDIVTDGTLQRITAPVVAEFAGYGLEQSLGTFTVHNDPAAVGGLESDGTSGDDATTPDDADLDITADIDLRADVSLDDWTTASEQNLVAKYNATGDQRSYRLLMLNNLVRIVWSPDGTIGAAIAEDSSVAPSVGDGNRLAVRATLDVDNGASGYDVTFYTADSLADADANGWTQLGTVQTGGATTSIHSGTADLEVGSADGGTTGVLSGIVHAVVVSSGAGGGGSVRADPDFEAEDAGTTSFADSTGKTWTVQGGAAIVDRNPTHFDIPTADIKGDVEAPMRIRKAVTGSGLLSTSRNDMWAMRRRDTPASVPYLLQAEDMTQVLDTSVQTGDAAMSGPGDNYSQCDFATSTLLGLIRLATTEWPSTPGVDVRGTYRVFARVRKTVKSDEIRMQLGVGGPSSTPPPSGSPTAAAVTLPAVTVPSTGVGLDDTVHVDLGVVQFPVGVAARQNGPSGEDLAVEGARIEVSAARDSGTGSLDIDYLLFVPADERMALLTVNDDFSLSADSGVVLDSYSDLAYIHRSGDDAIVNNGVGDFAGSLPMLLPGVTNRIYYLDALSTQVADVSLSRDIDVSYWPRYLSIRPND